MSHCFAHKLRCTHASGRCLPSLGMFCPQIRPCTLVNLQCTHVSCQCFVHPRQSTMHTCFMPVLAITCCFSTNLAVHPRQYLTMDSPVAPFPRYTVDYTVDSSLRQSCCDIHVPDFFHPCVRHVFEGLNFENGGWGVEKGNQDNPQLVLKMVEGA